ncbi:MAG: outer membrane lipid asymmetry maintenance protein MlaD, partial [Gammaproteobacteria bacterium]
MRQTRTIEISTGLFIILGFSALFFLATQTTNIGSYGDTGGYNVTASFTNVGGLKVRAPVTMAGVAVGSVTAISLDPQTFNAVVTLRISGKYNKIPDDSSASILTSGLLGEQYVGLTLGGSETFLKNGSKIQFTQSAIILENLIGQFLFN